MNDYGTLLVPVDFSLESAHALRAAEAQAAGEGHALVVLHVMGPYSPLRQRPPVLFTDPLEDCVRSVTRVPPNQVSFLALDGDPVEQILNVANLMNCHAIVMGRGGTPARPGHVALGVQRRFPHALHLVSRGNPPASPVSLPAVRARG